MRITAVELLHWLGSACLVSSVIIRFIPTPEEITAHWYLVLYNVIRRMSINSTWTPRNGNGNAGTGN